MTKITVTKINEPRFRLTLDLTEREARAVATVCRNIGGISDTSPRAIFVTLKDALIEAGISVSDTQSRAMLEDRSSSGIYFRNWSDIPQ